MMKLVLILGILIASASTLAANATSSWREILADFHLKAEIPLAGAFGEYGIFNACHNEDILQSFHKIKTCTEWAYEESIGEVTGRGTYCVGAEFLHNSIARETTVTECNDRRSFGEAGYPPDTCENVVTKPLILPLTYEVRVYRTGGEREDFYFTKAYTIPPCR